MNLIEQRPSEDSKQDPKSKKALVIAGTAVLAALVLFFIFSKVSNNRLCCLGEKTLAGSVDSISEEGFYLLTKGEDSKNGSFYEKKYLISFSSISEANLMSLDFNVNPPVKRLISWTEIKSGDSVFVYGEAKSQNRILANKIEVLNLLPPSSVDFSPSVAGNLPPPGENYKYGE